MAKNFNKNSINDHNLDSGKGKDLLKNNEQNDKLIDDLLYGGLAESLPFDEEINDQFLDVQSDDLLNSIESGGFDEIIDKFYINADGFGIDILETELSIKFDLDQDKGILFCEGKECLSINYDDGSFDITTNINLF